jgi:hypothetical protein
VRCSRYFRSRDSINLVSVSAQSSSLEGLDRFVNIGTNDNGGLFHVKQAPISSYAASCPNRAPEPP